MAPVLNLLPTPNGTASAQLLDPDHFQALTDALSNILSLEITRETIAQLFDGIPTWSVLLESQGTRNTKGAPVRKHTVLCDGALESAEAFIAAFDPLAIQYDPSLLQAFQDAPPNSDAFRLRLLELVARSIHCIATSIDKLADKAHVGDIREAIEFVEPGRDVHIEDQILHLDSILALPHLFFSFPYMHEKDYPFGISDMAGYWAESRIFGGVVLFDRGESGTEANSVWFHSGRRGWMTRVWKLLDWQFTSLTEFLLKGNKKEPLREVNEYETTLPVGLKRQLTDRWRSEFPFFCDIDNRVRCDSYDAMAYHNIYRDKWERDLSQDDSHFWPRSGFDYPEVEAMFAAVIRHPENFGYSSPDPVSLANAGTQKSESVQSTRPTAKKNGRNGRCS